MVFDYEQAWADLQHVLASDPRPNWGARQLRDEMGRILDRRRVNESGIEQMLRLYGVQVGTQLHHVPPSDADPTPPAIGHAGATVASGRSHPMTPGRSHDGRVSTGHAGADRQGEARGRAAA